MSVKLRFVRIDKKKNVYFRWVFVVYSLSPSIVYYACPKLRNDTDAYTSA